MRLSLKLLITPIAFPVSLITFTLEGFWTGLTEYWKWLTEKEIEYRS